MSGSGAVFGRCDVVAGERLPPSLGGSKELCRLIEAAVRARTSAAYRVELIVISPSRLSASITVGGRLLPEQRFAVMDGKLNSGAIQRFADALAVLIAEAAGQQP